jgi:hypothetical protein
MTASFDVRSPMAGQVLLMDLVQQAQAEGLARLLAGGISKGLLDHLRSGATASEIARMFSCRGADGFFTVTLNEPAILAAIAQDTRIVRDRQIKEYLAQHGASGGLLARWFSLSRVEADALRAAFAPAAGCPGRPRLPDTEMRDDIHLAWSEISPGIPEREAYYRLHRRFSGISVAALHQVIHEHDLSLAVSRRRLRRQAVANDGGRAGVPPERVHDDQGASPWASLQDRPSSRSAGAAER